MGDDGVMISHFQISWMSVPTVLIVCTPLLPSADVAAYAGPKSRLRAQEMAAESAWMQERLLSVWKAGHPQGGGGPDQLAVLAGILTIAPGTDAFRAKLCFVEIGQAGTAEAVAATVAAAQPRLAALVQRMNAQTGASPDPTPARRRATVGGPARRPPGRDAFR
jgi:hypothetical protein